jgi:hypothetical protein
MANKKFWPGILVMALVFGMTVVGCGGDSANNTSGGSNPLKYEGKDVSGNTYILTVTEKAGRAAYTPSEGDSYVLIIKITGQQDKTSSGTIKSIGSDGTFTLQPSIEGSVTFSITISGTEISSVTGDITVEKGETIKPRSFGKIYLRVNRWDDKDNGFSGEYWSTGTSIKLSDFYSKSIKIGDKIKISGTVDKDIGHFYIEFFRVGKNWNWIGSSSRSPYPEIKSGPFDKTFDMIVSVSNTNLLNNEELGEFIVDLSNVISYTSLEYPTMNLYGKIPENIPQGTIIATISNFNISCVSE